MPYADADLELDLIGDWTGFVRNELTRRGYTPPPGDEDARFAFFNLERRLVPSRPRRLKIASGLACPSSVRSGYTEVTRKVTAGEDLRPHLSRGLTRVDYNDGLLNDWGIHHLHLGTDVQGDGFVARTDDVLFARFTDEEAFFIAIQPHGAWADVRVLEEFHNSWPDVAARFQMPGLFARGPNPSSDELKRARDAGVQPLIQIDGKVIFPMGGGITTSRLSADVVRRSDAVLDRLRTYEDYVAEQREQIISAAAKGGVHVRPLRLRLRFEQDFTACACNDDATLVVKLGPL